MTTGSRPASLTPYEPTGGFVTGSNVCPACQGEGTLSGRNWVVQGYVDPNCWHCNGQGVVVPPTQPQWAK
jgi:DnaJ-class molecular chaperone